MPDGGGWKVAAWAWERRDEILKLLTRLRAWWRGDGRGESAPGLLILGPGGVGKTTLARLLAGETDLLLDPPGGYEPSLAVERYTLSGTPGVEVVVLPGQQLRREATWDDLLAGVTAGRYRGLVFVTAAGFDSTEWGSYRHHALYAGDKDAFVRALVAQQRVAEVAVLAPLLAAARLAPGRLWLLSVVAKQDLWWPTRGEVERHYLTGDYQTAVGSAFAGRDRRHEVCFASLVIRNWDSPAGERLRPNAEGYDQPLQSASLRRLIETLDALREWEEQA